MAREARRESPTGYYHAMMRGNNKEMIFAQISDKEYFLEQLQYQVDEGNIKIVGYCLMDNHVHLLIKSDLQSMSQSLKWINIKFAGRYNFKNGRIGHVFQDRYKSETIINEAHLVQVLRYIHNNPIAAKMVSKISEYKWSSYNNYIDKDESIINPKVKQMIMDIFSKSPKKFKDFHLDQDTNEFLEIKDDLDIQRDERAQKIIKEYCERYKINNYMELKHRKEILEEVVIKLIEVSNLTHRRISELLDISRGLIHSIAKKII